MPDLYKYGRLSTPSLGKKEKNETTIKTGLDTSLLYKYIIRNLKEVNAKILILVILVFDASCQFAYLLQVRPMICERDDTMYLLIGLLFVFWLLVVPSLIGSLVINQLFREDKTDLMLAVACGAACMMAIFYILVIPMLFLNMSLHVLVICWSVLMLYLCVIALIFNRKRCRKIIKDNLNQIKLLSWIAGIVILLVVLQTLFAAIYQHEDADDAFYVASATTSVATDSIFQFDPYTGLAFDTYPANYVLSPFPIFVALLSKLVMLHPAIIAHSVLPAVLIPLSYIVLALLAKRLFPDQPASVMYFLLFVCVLNIFGNVSVCTSSSFLLLRIWQGKAVLANIILPAILYFSLRAMSGKKNYGEWLILLVCSFAACLVSSMGIVLAPIMIVCLGIVFAIRNRSMHTFAYSIACCAPCITCGIIRIIGF